MSTWELTVKSLTGDCYHIKLPNGNSATGLDVKNAIQLQDSSLSPNLQRLVGPQSVKINDSSRLSSCNVSNGSTLNLVILTPFDIYVQGVSGKNHTVYVDSEMCTITELRVLIRNSFGHDMRGHQLFHLGRPVNERLQGTEMRLKDYSIKPGSTVLVTKMGLELNVTNAKIDVCFLVDCTGSMGSYIEAVKNNVKRLRDKLQEEYKNSDVVFSFVRYTDYDQPASSKTTYLPFTSDASVFRNFVGAIIARGGGDGPEDIMGGFKVAFNNLHWRSDSCKILIHIADAPCHGTQYHTWGDASDDHPSGDPAGITHESMMEKIVQLDIQYYFGYIQREDTDKMIEIFDDCLQALSQQRLLVRQFDAMNTSEIGEAVQRSVIASVYGKAALRARDYTLKEEVPDWNSPLIYEESGKKTPLPPMKKLSDLHDSKNELQKPTIDFEFKIAPNPFLMESECYVYYASDLVDFRKIVLKLLKENDTLENYMKKLENRVLAKAYACAFNEEKLKPQDSCSVDFVQLDIVESSGIFYMLEPLLKGKITKAGDNCTGKASSYFDLLEAFSHYTWVKSGKTLLISGLQGFKKKMQDKIVCTDPTIFSNGEGGIYGPMDSGMKGVKSFFDSHICSGICTHMKLGVQSS